VKTILLILILPACLGAGPLANEAAWEGRGEDATSDFGYKCTWAGDVNGDGFADALVSAPGYRSSTGKVYLYYGGPTGLLAQPNWTAVGEAPVDGFGKSMGGAGDLNGDGYADLYAAAPDHKKQFNSQGKLYVYYGGPKGPPSKPSWTLDGAADYEVFGDCTSPVGDINADGYADLIVGAYGYEKGRGKAELYLGSAQGLGNKPAWSMEGEADGDNLGYSHGAAGDFNGDGVADFLVGAKYNASAYAVAGKAWAFLGKKGGPGREAAWLQTGEAVNAMFANRLYSAGDVNGDGYGDVIAGAPGMKKSAGRAYLYLGSARGLSAKPAWTYTGKERGIRLGHSVNSAGDVNADGYDDVIVGSPGYPAYAGRAELFLGSKRGLSAKPQWFIVGSGPGANLGMWTASAGDVNGDGADDVLVGAGGADDNRGRAMLYLGRPQIPTKTVKKSGQALPAFLLRHKM
jgi:hypothetical protein